MKREQLSTLILIISFDEFMYDLSIFYIISSMFWVFKKNDQRSFGPNILAQLNLVLALSAHFPSFQFVALKQFLGSL